MIAKIKIWLLKPYPFPITFLSKFLASTGIGFFVFLFLLIFEPFHFYEFGNDEMYYALWYSIIISLVILINLSVFPLIFVRFFDINKWTIYKMILFVVEIMFVISISIWYFANQSEEYPILFYITATFLTGIFPLLLYLYINEKVATKNRMKTVKKMVENKKFYTAHSKNDNPNIVIIDGSNKEQLTIPLNDLLYISSEKNYASVFFLHNKKIKEALLRNSLRNIELQLTEYRSIIRCHKSYIVNTNQVIEIQGNARNYLLKIVNTPFLIPVSRSFPKELLFTLVK